MPTVALSNLGCKVNQYETERLAESFRAQGFSIVDFKEVADVYLINSCSVTADADKKSRHTARRAARQNPEARVILTGCFAQAALDEDIQVEGASLLVSNSEKMRTVTHVLNAFPDLIRFSSSPASYDPLRPAVFPTEILSGFIPLSDLTLSPAVISRTRATLKIQDGCQYFCSFCSIPFTRNVMASRPFDDVIAEARTLVLRGAKEIVVTGVCVGAYGPETGSGGKRLADVLRAVAAVDGLERVRLSSVQPVEIPDDVIEAMCDQPKIAPHLHLSAQSGDSTVLRSMNRPYDTDFFEHMVRKLRTVIPAIGLTTDLIVGFPGETDELFENTIAFARRIGFARTHVFRYSPRKRTAGELLVDDVAPEVKERRHRQLTSVCVESQRRFAETLISSDVDVLAESSGAKAGWLSGYTGNYIRTQFTAPKSSRGKIVRIRVNDITKDGDAFGEVVD